MAGYYEITSEFKHIIKIDGADSYMTMERTI